MHHHLSLGTMYCGQYETTADVTIHEASESDQPWPSMNCRRTDSRLLPPSSSWQIAFPSLIKPASPSSLLSPAIWDLEM